MSGGRCHGDLAAAQSGSKVELTFAPGWCSLCALEMKTALTTKTMTVRADGRLSIWQHVVPPLAFAGGDS